MSSNKRWPGRVLTRPGREQKIKKIVRKTKRDSLFYLYRYIYFFFSKHLYISCSLFFIFIEMGLLRKVVYIYLYMYKENNILKV